MSRSRRSLRLHCWILTMIQALLISAAAARAAADDDAMPVRIDAGVAQLFVDDQLIDTQEDLKRTLHQPAKDGGGNVPLLAIDQEFGGRPGTLQANGTILFDPKLNKWVMYAIGFSSMFQGPERVRLFRFTSPDAMNWTKGDDGTPQHIRFDLTNPATGETASNHDLFSCYYDAQDAQHPYKGWLWIWGGGLDGLYYVYSADGRTWQRGPQLARVGSHRVEQDGRVLHGPSDVTIFSHDQASGRFLAAIKFDTREPVNGNNHLRSRAYAFVDRLDQPLDLSAMDRVALVPPAAAVDGDQPHDQYYGSTAWRYESMWLGGLKVWHGAGDYPHSAAGSAFLKLASSRDGLRWSKVRYINDGGVPEVFLPNGPEGGNGGRNDGGYITEFSQPPLRIGDELIFYYGASSYGKNHANDVRVSGGGIFRARLRPDGFVSVDGGTLTTKPLAFGSAGGSAGGARLTLNSVGPVDVEVLTPAGDVSGEAAVTGDSLAHAVSFAGGQSLREIAPQGVARLRFTVRPGGRLYSFTVR